MQKQNMTKSKKIIKSLTKQLIFYFLIILIWQVIYYFGVKVFECWKSYAVPNPKGVLDSFIFLVEKGTLQTAVLSSLKRAFIGYGISVVFGMIIGVLVSVSKLIKTTFKPLILGIQTLPSICWVPFAILWFGLDDGAINFVIIMGSMFSIVLSVDSAIKNVNPLYIKAAKTMGIGTLNLYTRVIFPASLPSLLGGLRQGWSFAWRALMAGEVMSATIGLGQTLMMGRDLADINRVMVVMIVIVMVGVLIDKLVFSLIEDIVLKKVGYSYEE